MLCVGHDKMTLPIYVKFIENNNCMYTNIKLGNGLIYLH